MHSWIPACQKIYVHWYSSVLMEYLRRRAQWGSGWCISAVAAMGPLCWSRLWRVRHACSFSFLVKCITDGGDYVVKINKFFVVKNLLYQTVTALTVSVVVSKEKIGLLSEQLIYMRPNSNCLCSVWLRQIKMLVTYAKRKEILEASTRTLIMVTSFSSVVHEQLEYISPIILDHKKLSEVICLVRQYNIT